MERPSLYDVFEDLSLDELISALFTAQSEARQANARLRKLEFEVMKRMDQEDASILVGEGWSCTRSGARSYSWDWRQLQGLRPLFGGLWEAIVEVTMPTEPIVKVDTRKLLGLANRLSEKECEAIMACATIEQRGTKLEIKQL